MVLLWQSNNIQTRVWNTKADVKYQGKAEALILHPDYHLLKLQQDEVKWLITIYALRQKVHKDLYNLAIDLGFTVTLELFGNMYASKCIKNIQKYTQTAFTSVTMYQLVKRPKKITSL